MTQYARPDSDVSDDGNWESTNDSEGMPEFFSGIDESSADDGST